MMMIKCIYADETLISSMIIFKAINLNEQILSENIASENWKFIYNMKEWISNVHGFKWLHHCFESSIHEKINDEYRLLICDDHDNHIIVKFIEYCMNNKIILMILSSYISYLFQSLDIDVFDSIKIILLSQVKWYININITKLRKIEWFTFYIKVYSLIIIRSNIEIDWRESGLWSLNSSKTIHHLSRLSTSSLESQIIEISSIFETTLLTNSPLDAIILHSAIIALN